MLFLSNLLTALEKHRIATEEADNEGGDHGIPRSVRLQARSKWKLLPVNTMSLEASVEAKIGDTNAEPRHQACHRGLCETY